MTNGIPGTFESREYNCYNLGVSLGGTEDISLVQKKTSGSTLWIRLEHLHWFERATSFIRESKYYRSNA